MRPAAAERDVGIEWNVAGSDGRALELAVFELAFVDVGALPVANFATGCRGATDGLGHLGGLFQVNNRSEKGRK